MKYSNISLIVFNILIFFTLSADTQSIDGEKTSVSKNQNEEDSEFERQLKILNKMPITTITTKLGDTIDCIKIDEQPSFDHPLLKSHKIQMVPSSIPRETTSKNISSSIFRSAKIDNGFQGERCPFETVPIRRTKKQDLINAQYLLQQTSSYSYTHSPLNVYFVSVGVSEGKTYLGAEALMSVHEFDLSGIKYNFQQFSTGQIWIQNGPTEKLNSIEFGWMIFPGIYGDTHAHLFGYWTADGHKQTGCFDVLCPGFVQISRKVFLGAHINQTSKYGENPAVHPFKVYRDPVTGNWWLIAIREPIGYWPKEIFTHLAKNASNIRYGGITGNTPEAPTPPMGNGYFPQLQDYRKTAFMMRMHKVDEKGQTVTIYGDNIQTQRNATSDLYDITFASDIIGGEYDVTVAYGGPGAYGSHT